jgi:hypothetical protein
MKKAYLKPSMTALGLLRSITKLVFSNDPRCPSVY